MQIYIYEQILEVQGNSLVPKMNLNLKVKVLTLGSWWQGRILVESVVMLRLLNLPNSLLWRTCCLKRLQWVWPFGRSTSMSLLESFENLSAPRRWLKISGVYIFPVLWLRAWLLILIWMASLASLTTCLLSLSITLRGRCCLRGGCWKCYVCILHWSHDHCFLFLYFPKILLDYPL